jgi:hypothetical protein
MNLIGMVNRGYSQPTPATFHQQLLYQFRGYAAQVQQQQQQTQESKEGTTNCVLQILILVRSFALTA